MDCSCIPVDLPLNLQTVEMAGVKTKVELGHKQMREGTRRWFAAVLYFGHSKDMSDARGPSIGTGFPLRSLRSRSCSRRTTEAGIENKAAGATVSDSYHVAGP